MVHLPITPDHEEEMETGYQINYWSVIGLYGTVNYSTYTKTYIFKSKTIVQKRRTKMTKWCGYTACKGKTIRRNCSGNRNTTSTHMGIRRIKSQGVQKKEKIQYIIHPYLYNILYILIYFKGIVSFRKHMFK